METWIEDGKKMVSYTSEELQEMIDRGETETEWDKIGTMSDAELEAIIAADPDDFLPSDEELANARRAKSS